MDEKVRERHKHIGPEDIADERLQPELLAIFDQQQIGGDNGHVIRREQRGPLVGRQAQRALDERQVRGHEGTAECRP